MDRQRGGVKREKMAHTAHTNRVKTSHTPHAPPAFKKEPGTPQAHTTIPSLSSTRIRTEVVGNKGDGAPGKQQTRKHTHTHI